MRAHFRKTFTAKIKNIYCENKKHILRNKKTYTAKWDNKKNIACLLCLLVV